jgi:nitroreductase
MLEKPAITQVAIHEIIAKRWSPRAFADKYLSQTQILALLEAARWAPSCRGEQPWRFVVCDKKTQPHAWQKAYSSLIGFNQDWAVKAPVLIIASVVKHFAHNNMENQWAEYDLGAACENICLQAVALGLVTHQMAGFEVEQVRQNFHIPDNIAIISIIAVGYQDYADSISIAELREREYAPRERMDIEKCCFFGNWQD